MSPPFNPLTLLRCPDSVSLFLTHHSYVDLMPENSTGIVCSAAPSEYDDAATGNYCPGKHYAHQLPAAMRYATSALPACTSFHLCPAPQHTTCLPITTAPAFRSRPCSRPCCILHAGSPHAELVKCLALNRGECSSTQGCVDLERVYQV